jgi:hypothetical protein
MIGNFQWGCRSRHPPFDWLMEAHMKCMLLIYVDELALSETEREECYGESTQLAQQLKSSGQYLAANPLHPTSCRATYPPSSASCKAWRCTDI